MQPNHESGSAGPAGVSASERRLESRDDFEGEVTIDLTGIRLAGPGRNVSNSGVYFVAEGTPRVQVRIEGADGTRLGELVRVERLGAGRVGVAVRFVDVPAGE